MAVSHAAMSCCAQILAMRPREQLCFAPPRPTPGCAPLPVAGLAPPQSARGRELLWRALPRPVPSAASERARPRAAGPALAAATCCAVRRQALRLAALPRAATAPREPGYTTAVAAPDHGKEEEAASGLLFGRNPHKVYKYLCNFCVCEILYITRNPC